MPALDNHDHEVFARDIAAAINAVEYYGPARYTALMADPDNPLRQEATTPDEIRAFQKRVHELAGSYV